MGLNVSKKKVLLPVFIYIFAVMNLSDTNKLLTLFYSVFGYSLFYFYYKRVLSNRIRIRIRMGFFALNVCTYKEFT